MWLYLGAVVVAQKLCKTNSPLLKLFSILNQLASHLEVSSLSFCFLLNQMKTQLRTEKEKLPSPAPLTIRKFKHNFQHQKPNCCFFRKLNYPIEPAYTFLFLISACLLFMFRVYSVSIPSIHPVWNQFKWITAWMMLPDHYFIFHQQAHLVDTRRRVRCQSQSSSWCTQWS